MLGYPALGMRGEVISQDHAGSSVVRRRVQRLHEFGSPLLVFPRAHTKKQLHCFRLVAFESELMNARDKELLESCRVQ